MQMGTMADTNQSTIVTEPDTEVLAATAQPDDAIIETQLTQIITALWENRVRLSATRKMTAKELRNIRSNLAERLAAMKALLSRPGRGGQWSAWLREKGISRSTADRLSSRHSETLGADKKNCTGDSNPVPKIVEGLPGTASGTESVSENPSRARVITEEPLAEAAATPPNEDAGGVVEEISGIAL
jgi:hypothetical protein